MSDGVIEEEFLGSVEIQVWRRPADFHEPLENAVEFGARLDALLDEFGIDRIASQTGPGTMRVSYHLEALARAERCKEPCNHNDHRPSQCLAGRPDK